MRVVVAPDKFAGTMSASEAAAAISRGWLRARPHDDIVTIPMADGGDGLLDVVAAAVACERRTVDVSGPLGEPVTATWLLLRDGRAVIEVAEAIGLRHVPPEQRDPLRATSAGAGQLIVAAAAAGCFQIVVGLGGSGTVDGGSGMAAALGAAMSDRGGAAVTPVPLALADVAHVTPLPRALPPVMAAIDVDNPLLGAEGAAAVFAAQKGGDEAAIAVLESAVRQFADVVERDLAGGPWRDLPGAGAAGGLGFALAAFTGAELSSGAAVVADLVGLADAVAAADVVVTGEGSLDQQTLRGKAPDHVRTLARAAGVPIGAVAGRTHPAAAAAFDAVAELGPQGLLRPIDLTEECAADLATRLATSRHRSPRRHPHT